MHADMDTGEGNGGDGDVETGGKNSGSIDVQPPAAAAEWNGADEICEQPPEGNAGVVHVESDGRYLPELVLGLGLGAIALGLEQIINQPSDALFKHRAVAAVFYAAQVVEVILGILLLFIFSRWLKTAGVQRRQWHQTGKLFMILSFLPVILSIILVVCAKYTN